MTKIFFPFNDQPKRFPFKLSQPIRFPFIVNDLVYYWDVGTPGITLYINSEMVVGDTPTLKDIILEDTGIVVYLHNNDLNISQQINISFEQISAGIHTLGLLDPFTLGDIDYWTLGEISTCCADWLMLKNDPISIVSHIDSQANNVQMQIDSSCVLPYLKNVYLDINQNINLSGLTNPRYMTLGELDPQILNDIDTMLSTFNILEKIPAYLTKCVYIAHNNILKNNVLPPLFNKETNGSNIGLSIECKDDVGAISGIYSSNGDDIALAIQNDEAESKKAVFVTVSGYIGLSNGSISLSDT